MLHIDLPTHRHDLVDGVSRLCTSGRRLSIPLKTPSRRLKAGMLPNGTAPLKKGSSILAQLPDAGSMDVAAVPVILKSKGRRVRVNYIRYDNSYEVTASVLSRLVRALP